MQNTPEERLRVSYEVISDRAQWYLNHSAIVPPSVSQGKPFHNIPRLRLWDDAMDFGTEAEPTTLTVFELPSDGDERGPVVREAVWQRTRDLRRLQELVCQSTRAVWFEPTMAVRDAPVPAPELNALLHEAASLSVPVVWLDEAVGVTCDVGTRGFDFFSRDQPPAVLRLEWSQDKPATWGPIVEWFIRVRVFLEGCLAQAAEDG